MKYFSSSQFRTAYALLSEKVQYIIHADDTREKMLSAITASGVTDEKKKEDLSYLFDTVLYALVTEEEAITEVKSILSATDNAAKQVVDNVHGVLFKDIAEDLHKVHGLMPKEALAFSETPPQESAKETQSSGVSPEKSSSVVGDTAFVAYLKDPAVQARFQKLPPSIQKVVLSKELGDVFRSIVTTFSLSQKQKDVLGAHAVAVLAGSLTIQLFREKIAKESELPAQTLEKLLGSVEQGMFLPVRSAILKVLEQKG